MKPGYDFLASLPDLASYVGWKENLVLNATLPEINSEGFYRLCSPYDGRRMKYTGHEILHLIAKLQPRWVVMPPSIWRTHEQLCQSLPETIFPFYSVGDLPNEETQPHGVHLHADEKTPTSILVQQLEHYKERPCYITGDLNLSSMANLFRHGALMVESDKPANDATLGQVYCSDGVISLQEDEYSQQFRLIDESCTCPTCTQGFTRAYLHHLLEHTPLLCQRFLVQHNAHFSQSVLRIVEK
jgi:queuine tRNA-ribosyltransferase